MAIDQDRQDQITSTGSNQGNSPAQDIQKRSIANSNALMMSNSLDVLNTEQDIQWAYNYKTATKDNPYYDYYYSGQDIQVMIDGADSSSTGGTLPIASMAFNIKQEKTPLYGFWSYTFDAVMRGVRIINGTFTITTSSLNYMKNLLASAATSRANKQSVRHPIRGLDIDEENIEKYWTRNLDASAMQTNTTQHIWSSHPPFNFVIIYGTQDISAEAYQKNQSYIEASSLYKDSPHLYMDINERLVSAKAEPLRYVLENVELTSMQVEYTPDGQPIGETYSFLARDMYVA